MTIRLRPGQFFMPDKPLFGLEQEYSLELPLGYAASAGPQVVAVLLHAYHVELLPEIRAYLGHIPVPADLFVSTDTEAKQAAAASCFAGWDKGALEIRVMPNRGRDVAPKVVGFADVHDRYEYVLHLHTKSSPHDTGLAGWRGYSLETLLGSPAVVHGVFEVFARRPGLGMVAPQHIDQLRSWISWGVNHPLAEGLARRMGIPLPGTAALDFPSGSMFWARSAALRPLLDLRLRVEEFAEEAAQTDGTLAHAVERLYFLVCERAGFDWLKVTARGELHDQSCVVAVSNPQQLDRFLARHNHRLLSQETVEGSATLRPDVAAPSPRPRRVSHITWRGPLGVEGNVPPGRRLVVALHGEPASPALVRSVEAALQRLPSGASGTVLAMPNTTRAAALQAGFASGADLVLTIDAPGLLHPHACAALLQMSEAHGGRVLMQVAGTPGTPLPGGGEDMSIPWAAPPALAIPRRIHDALGGYDDALSGSDASRDYSHRARGQGFAVCLCPGALFHHAQALTTPEARCAV